MGLRVGDIEGDFLTKYNALKERHLRLLSDMGFTDFDITDEERAWLEGIDYLRRFPITDTEVEINQALAEGKNVLAEGAQGSLLDIRPRYLPLRFVVVDHDRRCLHRTGRGSAKHRPRVGYLQGVQHARRFGAVPG